MCLTAGGGDLSTHLTPAAGGAADGSCDNHDRHRPRRDDSLVTCIRTLNGKPCESIEFGVVVRRWGLEVNSISVINLVMAVGLVVDYSAHVIHNFVRPAS